MLLPVGDNHVTHALVFFPKVCVLEISVSEMCPAGAGGKYEGVPRPPPEREEERKHTQPEREEKDTKLNVNILYTGHADTPALRYKQPER